MTVTVKPFCPARLAKIVKRDIEMQVSLLVHQIKLNMSLKFCRVTKHVLKNNPFGSGNVITSELSCQKMCT